MKYLYRMRYCRARPGVHLLPEGVGQLMQTFHATASQGEMFAIWNTFRAWAPMPDLLVFVEASDEDIASRRAMRANKGDRDTPRLTIQQRAACDELKAAVLTMARSERAIDFFVVRNGLGESPGRLARDIAAEIVRRLPRAAGRGSVDASAPAAFAVNADKRSSG
jgi:hypothetical protein